MSSTVREDVINELHRSARKNFPRRRVIIKGLNDLLQIDMAEMRAYAKVNKGFKYILVVINVFSKFVWCEPVKNKTAKEVTSAMEKILKRMKTTCRNLQSDRGTEFINSNFKALMHKWKINHYSTYSNLKASVIERLIRTLKNKIWKQFSLQGNYKWLDLLPEIVKKYNNTVHHTIKLKPINVGKENEQQLLNTVYSHLKTVDPRKIKFKVNDYVRISKYKEAFTKGYIPNWSNEIFKITRVKLTNPTTYELQDSENKPILGGFYEFELQKVKHPNLFLVEKVLRRKKNKVYVKFLGLSNNHNEWISKKELII